MAAFLFTLQSVLVFLSLSWAAHPEDGFKCPLGFTGNNCEEVCPTGTFGDDCKFKCGCLNGTYCSPIDGTCDCRHSAGENGTRGAMLLGLTGLLCDRPCSKGHFSHMCSLECPCDVGKGECDPNTGKCQCLPGFEDSKCTLPCNPFKYGLGCNKKCECIEENSHGCDPITGRCICKVGWHGWICNSECLDGLWGANCTEKCSCGPGPVPCKQSNGSECLCPEGWMLDRNGQCSARCPNGTYGYGCNESCIVWKDRPSEGAYKMPGTTCDAVTGDLICAPGYEGLNCWNSCPEGKYGLECKQTCKCQYGDCHHITGECRCYKGWRGKECSEMCPEGTFGYNCTLKCIPCQNGGYCVHRHECICPHEWKGKDCSERAYGFQEELEKSSVRISLVLAGLMVAITFLMVMFFIKITRSDRMSEYNLTQLRSGSLTRVESSTHIFDGNYRNMVRVEEMTEDINRKVLDMKRF